MNNIQFLSVSAINKYIAYKFEVDKNLEEVYLQGEISNFKFSGKHCYFSLKDQDSEISAMFFYPNNLSLNFKPMDGMSVQVVGKIQVYQKKGTYAINIKKMAQAGIGLLYQEFLDLKEKLQKEGLFDENKKLPIPDYPEKVAVITASTGEAINDIISTFNRRFPLATIKLYPALVQGRDAPKDLIRALKKVYLDNDADVIIIGRGGGSFEDLSCFNDEELARLLFASKIPTISAVGHEGDYTICDFVASYRAPTPTGAAMRLTKDKNDVIEMIISYSKRLKMGIQSILTIAFQKWKKLSDSYGLLGINNQLSQFEDKLDSINARLSQLTPEKMSERLSDNLSQLDTRLNKSFNNIYEKNNLKYLSINNRLKVELLFNLFENKENQLNSLYKDLSSSVDKMLTIFDNKTTQLIDKIVLLNPFNIMNKGYSIVYKEDSIISSVNKLKLNDQVKIQFNDGKVRATINKINEREN